MFRVRIGDLAVCAAVVGFGVTLVASTHERVGDERPAAAAPVVTAPAAQDEAAMRAEITRQIAAGNGCLTCHAPDTLSMHELEKQVTCVECHGGNAKEPWNPSKPLEVVPESLGPESPEVRGRMVRAHVLPRDGGLWRTSADPERAGPESLQESAEFIQFVNPSDLRVADRACGRCHNSETAFVKKSPMTHGGMLWSAALYNNGSYPIKDAQFGEFYTREGVPARAEAWPKVTPDQTKTLGLLPFLQPLFRWELSQPGNILRIFERGGTRPLEPGIPDPEEEPGRPRNRLSNRGLGTLNRTDPVWIGLQKTRLLDPTL